MSKPATVVTITGMDQGFWPDLARPIVGLSPMDGVTDQPFRWIQKKYGQPDVVYTEFTSVEGVCHGADQLLRDFLYDQSQRPIVAQIYGTTPSFFRQTATVLGELGFDGIDINMGCPAKNVAHAGAGAALINTPQLAQQIITATQTGVDDWLNGRQSRDLPDITPQIWQEVEARHDKLPAAYQARRPIPVSIKTRIGYSQPVIDDWLPVLLEMKPAAIAIHGRTLTQHYGGQADWSQIGRAVEMRDQIKSQTLILGNGDINSLAEAKYQADTYGVDGVLIGRASLGNPFVFTTNGQQLLEKKRFQIALEHSQLFAQTYNHYPKYSFWPMRKHLGWYVRGVPHATEIRAELFQTNSPQEVEVVLQRWQLI